MNAFCGAIILLFSLNAPTDAPGFNVRDNVFAVLEVLGLNNSIDVTEIRHDYILAKPRVKNGTPDNNLWLTIQESRRANKKEWLHDNVFMSRLVGHGAYSYRQRGRPSMQAVFYFKKGSQIPSLIKLDVDRFPPSSNYVTSARHFIQEMIPNLVFGRSTDQERMAGAISRRYKMVKNSAGSVQASAPTPIE